MHQGFFIDFLILIYFIPIIYSLSSIRGSKSKNLTITANATKCQLFEYNFTNITIIFFFVQIFSNVYLVIKYTQPEFYETSLSAFLYQNYALLVFSPVGLLIYQAFYGLKYAQPNYKALLIYTPIAFLGVAFFQIIIITLTKISISAFDLFLFFASTAIAEEFLFRYGIQLGLEKFFKLRVFGKSGSCEYLSAIGAILIASLVFGLYHLFVKNDINLLFAVFVSALILGICLRLSKSIDVTIIAHFAINLLVTYASNSGLV